VTVSDSVTVLVTVTVSVTVSVGNCDTDSVNDYYSVSNSMAVIVRLLASV